MHVVRRRLNLPQPPVEGERHAGAIDRRALALRDRGRVARHRPLRHCRGLHRPCRRPEAERARGAHLEGVGRAVDEAGDGVAGLVRTARTARRDVFPGAEPPATRPAA